MTNKTKGAEKMEGLGIALVISGCCSNAVIAAKNKKVNECPVCNRPITEFIRSKVLKIMKKAK